MKTILISLSLLLGLSAFGQTAVRSLEGNATNLNTWTEVSFFRPNTTFTPLGTGFLLTVDGVPVVSFQPGGIATSSNFVAGGVITGNGSGLTNLSQSQAISNFTQNVTFQTNVTFLQNVTFSGKATLVSNVFLSQLSYATNHAAVTTLRLGCNYQAVTTNNNVAYTGFDIPSEYGVTNIAWASVIHTNTSGSLKTLTFAGCIGDTTVYVTNQTAYTVVKYPGMGTNVVSRPLN